VAALEKEVHKMRLNEIVQLKTVSGKSVTVGDTTVTPQSQALIVRWRNGGYVWNRPLAVLVERNGEARRIPIIDVTRVARLGLLVGALAVFLAIRISISRQKEGSNE
jgi:hypothetical protein